MHRKINAAKVLLCYLSRIELTINPILIELELTNVCNRRCVMCPNDRMTRASGFMDWTLFTDIVNQTIDTALEYSFDFQGEPTLHPRFLEMVNYVKQRGGRIALYTNMNFHDENLNDELVNSGIDKIVVSLHGTGDESYRIISPDGDYSRVAANLGRLKRVKKQKKKMRPVAVVNIIRTVENEGKIAELKREAARLGDVCEVNDMHDWAGDHDVRKLRQGKLKTKGAGRCIRLWTTAAIMWDGRIAACCYDYDGKVMLGDAGRDSITAIWNSDGMKEFRKNGRRSGLCCKCNDLDPQFSIKNIFEYLRSW